MAIDNKHFKYERFAKDVADHQMTVLMDIGVYRHLMFKKPDRSEHWFEIVTTPGMLVIRGDMETWVFSRIPDMFNFFRGKDGEINADYWQEKLLAGRSIGHPRFDKLGQRLLVQLLQLAAAALAEVAADRRDVVRPGLDRAIGQQHVPRRDAPGEAARRGDAVALGGDADDRFGGDVFRFGHRQAA